MKKLNVIIPISNQSKENQSVENVITHSIKNDIVHNEKIDKFLYQQYSLIDKNKLTANI